MTSPIPRLAALLMALALAAAACGSGDSGETAAPAAESADSPATSSILDISAPTADGSTLDLSTYAGQDLMLWFWAPW